MEYAATKKEVKMKTKMKGDMIRRLKMIERGQRSMMKKDEKYTKRKHLIKTVMRFSTEGPTIHSIVCTVKPS